MLTFLQDFRYAVRQYRKSLGFTAVAVVTLALGIGANTAIFSVVNGVLLRPLAFKDPDRLVRVWHVPPPKSFPGMTTFSVSAANYLDWERQNHVFERMAIYTYHGFTLTGGDKPEQVDACAATSGFFATLGMQPVLGRVFTPEEDQPGRSNVVVLSHRLWQEHFGSNPAIVGQNIKMDGQSYLVAGVMPASFPVSGLCADVDADGLDGQGKSGPRRASLRGRRPPQARRRCEAGSGGDEHDLQPAGAAVPGGQQRMGRRGRALARRSGQRCATGVVGSAGSRGFRSSHRQRQCGQSCTGEDFQPPEGDCDSNCAGRQFGSRCCGRFSPSRYCSRSREEPSA